MMETQNNKQSTLSGLSQPFKVLVIDDEPLLKSLFLKKFSKKIESHELEFLFAYNGKEGLDILNQDTEIGVILTDLNMPVMDGITLLKKLSELDRLYRTVVITAYGDIQNIRAAMNAGASDFIMKPIDFIDLELTLDKIMKLYAESKKGLEAKFAVVELNKELALAHQIQDSMMPKNFQPFPHYAHLFDIFGHIYTGKQFTGAFFDFFPIDSHRLALFIGNSLELGIPAALFMNMVIPLARGYALINKLQTNEILSQINKLISNNNQLNIHGSIFFGVLNMFNGEFIYSNAGHYPPIIVNKEGVTTEAIKGDGAMLGLAPNTNYEELKLKLKTGDLLFFYTKGLVDSSNKNNETYSKVHIEEYLKNNFKNNIQDVVTGIKNDLGNFLENAIQINDFSIISFRSKF